MATTQQKSPRADDFQHEIARLRQELAERDSTIERLEQRLSLSDSRDRLMLETMSQGVLVFDRDGVILEANTAAQQTLGLSRDELLGRRADDPRWQAIREDESYFPKDFLTVVSRGDAQSVRDIIAGVYNPRLEAYRWLVVRFFPLRHAGDTAPYAIYAIFDDITERRAAEARLRRSEAQYRYLFEHFPYPMWVFDAQTYRFLEVNGAAIEKYGYSRDEFLAMTINDLRPPEESERLGEWLTPPTPMLRMHSLWRHTLKDRRVIDVDISAHAVQHFGDHARLVIAQDVTARVQAEQALRQSEARFATIFEHSPIALTIIRMRDAVIVDANRAVLALFGYSREQVIGRTVRDVGAWMRIDERKQILESLATQQRIAGFETVVRLASGDERPALFSGEVVQIGEEAHLLLQIIDISELKAIQHQLLELNRTLETRVRERTAEVQDLYDRAPAGYYSLDAEGRIVNINQTLADWLGYTREEILGRPFSDFIGPENYALFAEGFPLFKSVGQLVGYEGEFQRRDGSRFDAMLSVTAVYNEDGAYLFSRANVIDNTERKQAERALRQSEEQNRLLFEESPEPLVLFADDGRMLRVNHAFADLVGCTNAELVGRTFDELGLLTGEQSNAIMADANALTMEDAGSATAIYELTPAGGAPRIVNIRTFALTIGRTRRYLAAIHDITAEKRAEEALLLANAELAAAARAKDEFLANMSHELRTPINAILAFSESLQEQVYGVLNQRQRDAIHNVETSGRHLLTLVNDILDLAKIEASQLRLQIEQLSLDEICQASLAFIREQALKKNIQINYHTADPWAKIDADPTRLKQMLVNLLNNAVKFTPSGGVVGLEVHIDKPNSVICFSVHDNGTGIAPEDLGRLFKPFSQLDGSLTRSHEGTGLGLALVQRLAEMHNGVVSVESVVGKGSRFTITLPYHDPAAHDIARRTPAKPEEPLADRPIDSPRILLVDDNELNIVATVEYLRARGYQVATASNGAEALLRAAETLPQVILMDIQMAGMDGFEAMRRLRGTPAHAGTPIIALTALAMAGDKERCLAAGATAYVTKPVSLRTLVALIQQLLGRQ